MLSSVMANNSLDEKEASEAAAEVTPAQPSPHGQVPLTQIDYLPESVVDNKALLALHGLPCGEEKLIHGDELYCLDVPRGGYSNVVSVDECLAIAWDGRWIVGKILSFPSNVTVTCQWVNPNINDKFPPDTRLVPQEVICEPSNSPDSQQIIVCRPKGQTMWDVRAPGITTASARVQLCPLLDSAFSVHKKNTFFKAAIALVRQTSVEEWGCSVLSREMPYEKHLSDDEVLPNLTEDIKTAIKEANTSVRDDHPEAKVVNATSNNVGRVVKIMQNFTDLSPIVSSLGASSPPPALDPTVALPEREDGEEDRDYFTRSLTLLFANYNGVVANYKGVVAKMKLLDKEVKFLREEKAKISERRREVIDLRNTPPLVATLKGKGEFKTTLADPPGSKNNCLFACLDYAAEGKPLSQPSFTDSKSSNMRKQVVSSVLQWHLEDKDTVMQALMADPLLKNSDHRSSTDLVLNDYLETMLLVSTPGSYFEAVSFSRKHKVNVKFKTSGVKGFNETDPNLSTCVYLLHIRKKDGSGHEYGHFKMFGIRKGSAMQFKFRSADDKAKELVDSFISQEAKTLAFYDLDSAQCNDAKTAVAQQLDRLSLAAQKRAGKSSVSYTPNPAKKPSQGKKVRFSETVAGDVEDTIVVFGSFNTKNEIMTKIGNCIPEFQSKSAGIRIVQNRANPHKRLVVSSRGSEAKKWFLSILPKLGENGISANKFDPAKKFDPAGNRNENKTHKQNPPNSTPSRKKTGIKRKTSASKGKGKGKKNRSNTQNSRHPQSSNQAAPVTQTQHPSSQFYASPYPFPQAYAWNRPHYFPQQPNRFAMPPVVPMQQPIYPQSN